MAMFSSSHSPAEAAWLSFSWVSESMELSPQAARTSIAAATAAPREAPLFQILILFLPGVFLGVIGSRVASEARVHAPPRSHERVNAEVWAGLVAPREAAALVMRSSMMPSSTIDSPAARPLPHSSLREKPSTTA